VFRKLQRHGDAGVLGLLIAAKAKYSYVILITLGRELKKICPTEGKSPLPSHEPALGDSQGRSFAWCLFGEFLTGVEIVREDNQESSCSFVNRT